MQVRSRTAATPIAFIKAIVLAYEKYGVDVHDALIEAGISADLLNRPQARVTARQMEVFAGTAMRQLDDEALGWLSRKLPWGSMGMLCRASLSSPNLDVAIRRWCRHFRLLSEDILLSLTVDGATATYAVEERLDLGTMREFCLVTTLRNLHGFACWLIDSRIPLKLVRFPFAAPQHRKVYPLIFPGPIQFDAPRAEFSFDAQYLAMPLRRDERALQTRLKRALQLTVLQYRRDRLFVQRVRDLLQARAARISNAEAVARMLHVSTRTLHRQLEDEGSSLQQLKDEVRCELAMDQLCRTERPIKKVALAVGFRNEKSFSRAFRKWTGKAPSAYRRACGHSR